jgi:hypothetical protein
MVTPSSCSRLETSDVADHQGHGKIALVVRANIT